MTSKTVLAVVVGLAITTAGASGEDKPSPQELMAAAHKTSDLTVIGPYILTGTVVVNPGTRGEQTGHLAVHRDRERVRVDLEVAGQTETRITIDNKNYLDPGKLLIASDWPYEFDRSWDPRPEKTNSKYTLGTVSRRKISSVDVWCVERKYEQRKDQLCIDASRNVVLRAGEEEFLDFAVVGSVMFPQTIRIADPTGVSIEIRKVQVSLYPADASLFAIPAKAMEFETCDHETQPQVLDAPTPIRSNLSRYETNAPIRLYTFIDKEGKVAAMRYLTIVPAKLENKVTSAVMTWRFKPATCDGRPVNVATPIAIDGRVF
jgi:hypothetical protein